MEQPGGPERPRFCSRVFYRGSVQQEAWKQQQDDGGGQNEPEVRRIVTVMKNLDWNVLPSSNMCEDSSISLRLWIKQFTSTDLIFPEPYGKADKATLMRKLRGE